MRTGKGGQNGPSAGLSRRRSVCEEEREKLLARARTAEELRKEAERNLAEALRRAGDLNDAYSCRHLIIYGIRLTCITVAILVLATAVAAAFVPLPSDRLAIVTTLGLALSILSAYWLLLVRGALPSSVT